MEKSMTDLIIRPAIADDLPELVELCALHAAYENAPYDPGGKQQKLAAALFSSVPVLFAQVAEQRGKLLAYATATREFSTWNGDYFLHMDCLFVLEQARGNGLGERLLLQIRQLAKNLECTHIEWQTPQDNTDAIRFYRRLGATARPKQRFMLTLN
jgi:ribosomal protein S18 acetylase RimI-like enzyme